MSEVDYLVSRIKATWPQFQVSKQNLLQPTPDFVFRFYSHFVSEFHEKLSYFANTTSSGTFSADLDVPAAEDRLFAELSTMILKSFSLKFLLGDLYNPTPIRTKNFFKLLLHYISFLEHLLIEAEALGGNVFQAKDDFNQLLINQDEIIHKISENAQKKADLSEEVSELSNKHKCVLNTFKETEEAKVSKQKLYADKENQIDNFNMAIQNEQYELNSLESMKQDLLAQKITDHEYQNIIKTVETLKSESEKLDSFDVDMKDGLENENKILQHSAHCLGILSKYELNISIKELIEQEEELKIILNTLESMIHNKLNPLNQTKIGREQELLTANKHLLIFHNEFKQRSEEYKKNNELILKEIDRLSKENKEANQKHKSILSHYQKSTEKHDEDLRKMRRHFRNEYIKVSEVEKRVVDNFKDVLVSLK